MRSLSNCAIIAVLLVALAGCGGFFSKDTSSSGSGGGGGNTSGTHYLFAAYGPTNAAGTVFGFTIGSGGSLSYGGLNAALGGSPSAIAITPSNTYLYVANANGGVSSFAISGGTSLTPVTLNSVTAGTSPVAMVMNPAGTMLFALDLSSGTISAFTINSDGTLTIANGQALPSGANPQALAISPSGNFLYAGLGSTTTAIYAIGSNSSGNTFTQVNCGGNCTTTAFGLVAHPNGRFLYVADGSSTVTAYSLNSSTSVPTLISAQTGLNKPVAMALDSTGNYLLVATQGDNALTSYGLMAGGGLSKVGSIAVGSTPIQIAVDPGTDTAYVANSGGSPDVSAISVSSAGALSQATTATLGGNAMAVAVTH